MKCKRWRKKKSWFREELLPASGLKSLHSHSRTLSFSLAADKSATPDGKNRYNCPVCSSGFIANQFENVLHQPKPSAKSAAQNTKTTADGWPQMLNDSPASVNGLGVSGPSCPRQVSYKSPLFFL